MRIRKHEERYWTVTVGMREWHVSQLDRFIADLRVRRNIAVSRSQVIRALIDLAEAMARKPRGRRSDR